MYVKQFTILVLCITLVPRGGFTIYDPEARNDAKTRGYHRDKRIQQAMQTEPIAMDHQYSQVASNRPSSGYKSVYDRHGRTTYSNDAENYVAQYGAECPPNATGQFPYLLNCRQFLNCWKGRGYVQSCAPGTVFNPISLECDSPHKVVCLSYRDPSNSNSHFAKIQDVIHPVAGVKSVKCSGDSGLESHPYECAKFLNCANGETIIQSCGPGTVFNPTTSVCDFPYNVDCGNRIGDQIVEGSVRRYPESDSSAGEGIKVQGSPQFNYHHHHHDYSHHQDQTTGGSQHQINNAKIQSVQCSGDSKGLEPHPYDCEKFLNCANGLSFVQSCGPGTVFNPTTSVCDYPYNVDCGTRTVVGVIAEDSVRRDPKVYETDTSGGDGRVNRLPQHNYHHHSHHYPHPSDQSTGGYHHHHHQPHQGYHHHNPDFHNSQHNHHGAHHYGAPPQNNYPHQTTWSTHQTPTSEDVGQTSWDRSDSGPVWKPDMQQAAVHRIPQSNYDNSGNRGNNGEDTNTRSTTIYWAQPVGTYDDRNQFVDQDTQQSIPVGFLTPPDPPKNSLNTPESTSRTTVYYAKPVGSYDKEYKTITRLNRTKPHGVYVNTEELQQQMPSIFLTPPDPPKDQLTTSASFPNSSSTQETYKNTYSSIHGHLMPPPTPPLQPSPTQPLQPEHIVPVPYGDLLPPLPDPINTQKTQVVHPETTVPMPYGGLLPPLPDAKPTNKPDFSVLYPPLPSVISTPTSFNQSRGIRLYPIYPPLQDSTPSDTTHQISYSPSYSGISHTKSNPSQSSIDSQFLYHNFNIPNKTTTNPAQVIPIYTRPSIRTISTTQTPFILSHIKTSLPTTSLPGSYNHNYYSPDYTTPSVPRTDEISNLPISEALKALFRPYHSSNSDDTIIEDVAKKMNEHIMKIPKQKPQIPDFNDAETIIAGEQDSLNPNIGKPDVTTDVDETPERRGHSHQFHHHHNHNHHHHHDHSWPHNTGHHSREFHRNNPHIRNPFTTNALASAEEGINYERPPDIELIDARIGSGETDPQGRQNGRGEKKCVFDCQNGKCIEQWQVCDGVNNCGNREDEKNCSHLGYEVRLSGEVGKPHMGRVEVKVLGKWGYVCDDQFGMRDAEILCHELGFPLGASEVRANSYYPPNAEMVNNNEVLFVMDEVNCNGNETSLRECDFKGWGVHDCSAEEVVGVVCKIPVLKCPNDLWLCSTSEECIPPKFLCDNIADCNDKSDENNELCNSKIEYRLIDGDGRLEGRLEVKYSGVWGTVCDDDFGEKEAQVLCNSMGLYGPASVIQQAYGSGKGPIWLDQVSCYGNETSLDKCNHWAWAEHNCNHTEDISIKCSIGEVRPTVETQTRKSTAEPMDSSERDMYLYELGRSGRVMNHDKRCGNINENVTDEFADNEKLARVVSGTKALRGHHPWQASIRVKGYSGNSMHWCGAVLITKRHLLTAAHCLTGLRKEGYFIRLGDHYSEISESSEIDVFIANWYIHEGFESGKRMNNDIALIVLKSPVMFNDYIQPICLPPKNAQYEEGMNCTISGWGSVMSGISTPSNNLRAAHVPIISPDVCRQPHVYGDAITEGMFCAGYLDEGVDACDGDSGGPLACTTPNGETLYGLISWGLHCGHINKPGVYVKITYYMDWIMEKIELSMQSKN